MPLTAPFDASEVLVPRLPAGLYGAITRPKARQLLSPRLFEVEGWSADTRGELQEFRVICQGIELGRSRIWQQAEGDKLVGLPVDQLGGQILFWSCAVEPFMWSGSLRLDVEVRGSRLDWTLLDSVRVDVGKPGEGDQPFGAIANLEEGIRLPRRSVFVFGYALHLAGPIRAVVLNLGGQPAARSLVHLPSAQALYRFPGLAWAAHAGWRAELDLSSIREVCVEVSVDALLPSDEWRLVNRVGVQLFDAYA